MMSINFKNSETEYGLISIMFHWLTAVIILALFILGLWMVDLTYYDEAYHQAPFIHKSVGMILLGLMMLRVIWRLSNPKPQLLSDEPLDKLLAPIAHFCLYLLVFAICISGYLIVTAADTAVSIFNWVNIPTLIVGIDGQEDVAGYWHWYLSIMLVILMAVHTLAAFKHHLINKNETLLRMLGIKWGLRPKK